ncbi:MAG: WG repeat-containing protein [Ferruginibacter sp.]|nr:WG repeat-containing protein [Ferruginibacter sp.]
MLLRSLLSLILLVSITTFLQAQGLVSFVNAEGKKGLKDKNGKMIVPALYDIVMKEQNGYVVVVLDKKYGAYDLNGKLVMPLIYDGLSTTSNRNQFFAKQNGKYEFVGLDGKVIKYSNNTGTANQSSTTAHSKTQASPVSTNPNPPTTKQPVRSVSGVNVTGSNTAPELNVSNGQQEFEQATLLYQQNKVTEGFVLLLKSAEKGYIKGMHNVGLFYAIGNGVKANLHEARKWLKLSAKAGYYKSIDALWGMDKAASAFLLFSPDRMDEWKGSNGKYGFFDDEFDEVIIPAIYEMGGLFSKAEGLAPAKLNGKWGFIDWMGKTVIPFQYEDASLFSFQDGKAAVKLNGKWGFINPSNQVVVPFLYESVEVGLFVNGYEKVKKNGKMIFIDTTGKEYVE